MSKCKTKCQYASVGGQALIEGIMMKGFEKTALAVRLPDGSIDVSYMEQQSVRKKYKILNIPIVRGVISFVESMIQGYKALMISADKSGFTDLEEETEKKEKTEESKKKDNIIISIIMMTGTVLGVALSVVLFMYLPRLFVSGLEYVIGKKITNELLTSAIEQFLKLVIFVGYVFAVSFMKDIKRVFMYHGAEHKTIFAYEKGFELTVENVRKQKRLHPRCGTSFMILMILISVILSTIIQLAFPGVYDIPLLWVLAKILLIPFTCGIGFEVLKACGKYDNILTRIISAPGMWLQKITTKEPEDDMIEIAIASLKACIPETENAE